MEFDRSKSLRKGKKDGKGNKNSDTLKDNGQPRKLIVSESTLQFKCHMNSITFQEHGEVGYYLQLEPIADIKKMNTVAVNLKKENERMKQPLFQFRYETTTGKFVREIKDSIEVDNAKKDPNFVNGKWVANSFVTPGEGFATPVNEIVTGEGGTGEEGTAPSMEEKKENKSEDLFERRKKWSL